MGEYNCVFYELINYTTNPSDVDYFSNTKLLFLISRT